MSSSERELHDLIGDLAQGVVAPFPVTGASWAACGGMHLTGDREGPPTAAPGDVAGAAELGLAVWAAHSARAPSNKPDARLLGERAAALGLRRNGDVSCGGAARLLPSRDGHVALSLARPEDVDLVPALTGRLVDDDPWVTVGRWASKLDAEEVDARLGLLGLPGGPVPAGPQRPRGLTRPGVLATIGPARRRHDSLRPRVLDLSALWAGPLCGHLLGLVGADVVKVEDIRRPDGARRGSAAFFDILHGGHRAVALDLADRADRDRLRLLAAAADVVLESSRPRALTALGLDAEALVAHGTTWVSITARGRRVEDGLRTGFGDDVAASAGLIASGVSGPVFCGDALADPLTGITAAAAVSVALSSGRAWLLDVSMRDVCRVAASRPAPAMDNDVRPASARAPRAPAPRLGQDTAEVLAEWCW